VTLARRLATMVSNVPNSVPNAAHPPLALNPARADDTFFSVLPTPSCSKPAPV